MGRGEDSLTARELEALANAFSAPVPARQLLGAAGIAPSRVPGWQAGSSLAFWHEVDALLEAGILPDGRHRLLTEAARVFPANPAWSAWGTASSAAARAPRAAEPGTTGTTGTTGTHAASTDQEERRDDAEPAAGEAERWDFHVSYADADEDWAAWVAFILDSAGYQVHLRARETVAGARPIHLLEQAIQRSVRTIAVLSPSYVDSAAVQVQWQAAWESDPQGIRRLLLPVRVREVRPPTLLRGINYIDLVGLDVAAAERKLLDEVEAALVGRRHRPTTPPPYPGHR
ncbi:TIR domain-containing protein [Frankia sp. EI5c]|uniref:toll/interleukin-1 receptor domain-containing protein n=1 Tax=Frankia sp. EI5c TaxID=683316 RepID=UPI0007C23689|nr:toll/interleukin-1 receptor domain-containing protein [Frankia sp. EI5c]OAA25738.1 TIR domain-containing protein [Frankia sp. EI5c]